MKGKFKTSPELAIIDDDATVIKNFGFGRFADHDVDDEDLDEPDIGIFEGDPMKDREEYKERLLDHFFG